ncbi:MAG: HAD family phosphatase [Phycisphaerae bacterium]|nr:HAD family phosphatase [Phycisphaerae bacterium]
MNSQTTSLLYISDLDGTLLCDDATLSAYARDGVSRLLDAGVHFTIASARSLHSLRHILGAIPFRLPVIEINGAFITDYHTGEHLVINRIDPETVGGVFACILGYRLLPFVSTYNGEQDCLYFQEIINGAMQWYHDDRKANGDRRLRQVRDITDVFGEDVISMNVMGRHEEVRHVAAQLAEAFAGKLENFFFENPYSPGWWWLTIHDRTACKSIAIRELAALAGFHMDDLTVFGDNLNDVKMFRMAARAVAVANATDEIKQYAHQIIGANTEDSVVKFILNETKMAL